MSGLNWSEKLLALFIASLVVGMVFLAGLALGRTIETGGL